MVPATLRVLSSSIMLTASGVLRVYVAFILLGSEINLVLCLAAGLVVYAVYTLDRVTKGKEDEFNRPEEDKANRRVVSAAVITSLLAAIILLYYLSISFFGAIFPFVMGLIYGKGIRVRGKMVKLKGGMGVKNTVVAFTWAVFIYSMIYSWVNGLAQLLLLFSFFFLKSFIYTVICDCRDVEGDSIAGLKTFPASMGIRKTRSLLQILHLSFHSCILLLLIFNLVGFNLTILAYSWLIGLVYIQLYANSKKTVFRSVVVHGEWLQMIVLKRVIQSVLSVLQSA